MNESSTPARAPEISVVIPVFNGGSQFTRCLDSLYATIGVDWECVVVDDGSTDNTAAQVQGRGARVVRASDTAQGPGNARNIGVSAASAPLVMFLDADVLVRPDTLSRFVTVFAEDPNLAAAFGSYDADPDVKTTSSDYRNLLHHYTHQTGQEDASTFWAGCGAVRRDIFLEVGGFDPAYDRPCIEDIDLGYRLRMKDLPIRLVKEIQVKHLKHWTLWKMIKTDIRDRALAWTELIVRSGYAPTDLNLNRASRASAMCVHLLLLFLLLHYVDRHAWMGCAVLMAILVVLNRGLYVFFMRRRGVWFTLKVLPLHWLYFLYSSQTFAFGMLWYRVLRKPSRPFILQSSSN
jgi:glycosyltransferase involved in cell wall biosynthesis